MAGDERSFRIEFNAYRGCGPSAMSRMIDFLDKLAGGCASGAMRSIAQKSPVNFRRLFPAPGLSSRLHGMCPLDYSRGTTNSTAACRRRIGASANRFGLAVAALRTVQTRRRDIHADKIRVTD
jgi:hypothetical protein